jgi:hypothetical protein
MSLKERCSNMSQANRYIGDIIKKILIEENIEYYLDKSLLKNNNQ